MLNPGHIREEETWGDCEHISQPLAILQLPVISGLPALLPEPVALLYNFCGDTQWTLPLLGRGNSMTNNPASHLQSLLAGAQQWHTSYTALHNDMPDQGNDKCHGRHSLLMSLSTERSDCSGIHTKQLAVSESWSTEGKKVCFACIFYYAK